MQSSSLEPFYKIAEPPALFDEQLNEEIKPGGVILIPWGEGKEARKIVATYGSVELEYSSLHKGVGIVDRPDYAILKIQGKDRIQFLESLLTNTILNTSSGNIILSFILDRKGRIIADVSILILDKFILLNLDRHQANEVLAIIQSRIFLEDIKVIDLRSSHHVIEVYGPQGENLIKKYFECDLKLPLEIDGFMIFKDKAFNMDRLKIIADTKKIITLWKKIFNGSNQARGIGWYALNIKRVESRHPMMNLDFSKGDVPNETSLLSNRVSFNKGCYPGQEVVARIKHLGQPKKKIVELLVNSEIVPVAGTQLFKDADSLDKPVGHITSSAPSPMSGGQTVCMGMVKQSAYANETKLIFYVDNSEYNGTVRELLK